MKTLMGIDPGDIESAYCIIEVATRKPLGFGKMANTELLELLTDHVMVGPDGLAFVDYIEIEMIDSYGMAVGKEIFETVYWVGRFHQMVLDYSAIPFERTTRRAVKVHHCHSSRATDANVKHALADRFAPGQPSYGKGTKDDPGWFYGFAGDVWQAYALAVCRADVMLGYEP